MRIYSEILRRIDEVSDQNVEIIRDWVKYSYFIESEDDVEYYDIDDKVVENKIKGIIMVESIIGIDEEISINGIIDGNYVQVVIFYGLVEFVVMVFVGFFMMLERFRSEIYMFLEGECIVIFVVLEFRGFIVVNIVVGGIVGWGVIRVSDVFFVQGEVVVFNVCYGVWYFCQMSNEV